MNDDKTFEPLIAYLDSQVRPDRDEYKTKILGMMMYMGEAHGTYHYKNQMTRRYIVLYKNGKVAEVHPDALTIDE